MKKLKNYIEFCERSEQNIEKTGEKEEKEGEKEEKEKKRRKKEKKKKKGGFFLLNAWPGTKDSLAREMRRALRRGACAAAVGPEHESL